MNREMPKYDKILIWYFSGTGNARFAANKIADIAKKNGQIVFVYNMADGEQDFSQINENCLIGFCYPTHGFNAPPNVLRFIRKFPKNRSKIFLLNTRAGMKLFKLHTAGLGGLALWLPAFLLFLKGYKPIGFRPLDMPSNWISLHPGLTSNAVNFIHQRCRITINNFTNKIINKKPVLNGLLWLPLDIAVIPISLAYYFFGRFFLAKTFYASYNCTNCGLCIRQCPVSAIQELNGRPYWTFSCESCMKCMNNCPERAIETAHGYVILIWWLAFSIVPGILVKALVKYQIISTELYNNYFNLIFNASILLSGLIVVFLGYKILHQLLRIKFINKIITLTSVTHFKWWRRYTAD